MRNQYSYDRDLFAWLSWLGSLFVAIIEIARCVVAFSPVTFLIVMISTTIFIYLTKKIFI